MPEAQRVAQPVTAPAPSAPPALFASLELSPSRWLVTLLAPGSEVMSKHAIPGGDGGALPALLARQRARAERQGNQPVRIVTIQEAGLDGFWIHRLPAANGIESYVVEPASIAVARRHRRAKTDAIDGEALLRTLLAYKRGEPRACSMVVPPSPEEEDRRRLSRERKVLVAERIEHTNRVKGLLAAQGIEGYEPLRRDCRERLDLLHTGDGRPLPPQLKAEIGRALDRLALLQGQIAAVEAERTALLATDAAAAPAMRLLTLKSIGPEFASVLWLEGLFRGFRNRRQVAAYAGLAPSPWQSGTMSGEQGIPEPGNPRLRTATVELAWPWLRHQPDTALSRWFHERVRAERGRIRRITVVALARKLLVASWRFVTEGVIPQGAIPEAA